MNELIMFALFALGFCIGFFTAVVILNGNGMMKDGKCDCPCHKEKGCCKWIEGPMHDVDSQFHKIPSTPKTMKITPGHKINPPSVPHHEHKTGADSWEEELRLKVRFDRNQDREVCILFINRLILKSKNDEREAITKRIGNLRQWLNELPYGTLITNDHIAYWLGLAIDPPSSQAEKKESGH